MKIIISNNRISAIATDAYQPIGDEQAVIDAPEGFEPDHLEKWAWDGKTLSRTKPTVVSMRQARLALHGAGVLTNVNAMMDQADPAVAIEWEYATEVRRDHPMIAAMGQGLGLDETAIDALFVAASAIE